MKLLMGARFGTSTWREEASSALAAAAARREGGGDKAEGVPDSAQFITTRDGRRQRRDKTRDSESLMEPRNFTGRDNRRGRGNYQGDPPRRPPKGSTVSRLGGQSTTGASEHHGEREKAQHTPMNGPPTPPPHRGGQYRGGVKGWAQGGAHRAGKPAGDQGPGTRPLPAEPSKAGRPSSRSGAFFRSWKQHLKFSFGDSGQSHFSFGKVNKKHLANARIFRLKPQQTALIFHH